MLLAKSIIFIVIKFAVGWQQQTNEGRGSMKRRIKKLIALLAAVCVCVSTPLGTLAAEVVQEGEVKLLTSSGTAAAEQWIQVDSNSDQIKYTGRWYDENSSGLIGGNSKQTNVPGAAAEFTFHGTGIRWLGQKDTNYGDAKIYIDGEQIDQVSAMSASGNPLQSEIYTLIGLPKGEHVFKLEGVGPEVQWQNYIELDALEYTADTDEVVPDTLDVTPDSLTLKPGKSKELFANVLKGSAHVYKKAVKAQSEDTSIATIDENFVVTAVGQGDTKIKFTCGDLMEEVTVNVTESAKLRMQIDNTHPLIIHHMAREMNPSNPQTPGPIQGGHDIKTFWEQIPSNQKPYSAIVIHPGYYLNVDYAGHMEFLENQIKIAEENQIPFFVMIGNSFTNNFLSNAKMEEYYQDYEYCMGSAYSELHSSGNRNRLSNEMADKIELAAQYGGHVWIADMNDEGDSVEQLVNQERFYHVASENKENVILMSKTTSAWSTNVSYNSFESVTYGAWLSDICGNYGSLIDSWMWFIENYWKLYEEPDGSIGDHGPEECRGAFAFPELLYPMRMIQEAMSGATVFTFEHPFNSTGIRNQLNPVYNHAISKAVDYMLEQKIPTKQEMLSKTRIAYDATDGSLNHFAGSNSFDVIGVLYGDSGKKAGTEKTFLTQTTGRYGIVPSILPRAAKRFKTDNPEILTLTKTDIQREYSSPDALKALFNEKYPELYTGSGFAYKLDDLWFAYNSKWQKEMRQEVTLPVQNDSKEVKISFDNYTYVLLKEENGGYQVNLNNFLVDKDDIWEGYIAKGENPTPHWDSDNNDMWPTYLLTKYMPDGARRDEEFRNTTFVLTNQDNAPEIEILNGMYDSGNQHNQYLDPVVNYDPEAREAEISIDSNGWVEFVIREKRAVDKSCLEKKLQDAMSIKSGGYTEDSFKILADAITAAKVVLEDENATQKHIDEQIAALDKAIGALKPLPTQEEQDAKAAAAVVDKINGIKTVTLQSEAVIRSAREEYDRLTEAQKRLVSNYPMLINAENRLEELKFQEVRLTVNAKAVDADNLVLRWKKISDADGYVVMVKKGSRWSTVKTLKAASTSYKYTKGTAGKKCQLAVKAYKTINGKKVFSQTKTVTKKIIPAAPQAKAKAAKSKITLSWKRIKGASGYIVVKKAGKSYKKVTEVKANRFKFVDKSIKKNKKYSYKVRAYKKSGKRRIMGSLSKAVTIKAK